MSVPLLPSFSHLLVQNYLSWVDRHLHLGAGQLPVAQLLGGNDANTNPGLSSWEIQEVCPRKGGETGTFVKVLVPLGPRVNALSPLCLAESEE